MAWEFRKLGPGENVAVEAQRDPFAAPKWAPPVWHMPEGLVLLVNAVRALSRTVVFLARNVVPVSIAAGLGWLGYRLGWLVPVLVLAPTGDRVVAPEAVARFASACPGEVEVKRYEGFQHEALNEAERHRVIADVAEWLDRTRARA